MQTFCSICLTASTVVLITLRACVCLSLHGDRQEWQKCSKMKYGLYYWICAIMCYKWVENYTKFNINHSEENMDYICCCSVKYIGWNFRSPRSSKNLRNTRLRAYHPATTQLRIPRAFRGYFLRQFWFCYSKFIGRNITCVSLRVIAIL